MRGDVREFLDEKCNEEETNEEFILCKNDESGYHLISKNELHNLGNEKKPPIGAIPFYIVKEQRIQELKGAIERWEEYSLMKDEYVQKWKRELILWESLNID